MTTTTSSSKSALIVQGGWEGHEPRLTTDIFLKKLQEQGFGATVADSLSALDDKDYLASFSLIVPNWTMGELSKDQSGNLSEAVRGGVGLGGFHGGMGDAFRGNPEYEWMVGGHFVGHPHVGPYAVRRTEASHPITKPLPESFEYDSEQYYMLVDPAIEVLAETTYTYEGQNIRMPVVWTKQWGEGRVFYSALGHKAAEFESYPMVTEMTVNGMLWAARAF
ncbi:MAG: ThuA domain-containing protein [Opitutales bacterium]